MPTIKIYSIALLHKRKKQLSIITEKAVSIKSLLKSISLTYSRKKYKYHIIDKFELGELIKKHGLLYDKNFQGLLRNMATNYTLLCLRYNKESLLNVPNRNSHEALRNRVSYHLREIQNTVFYPYCLDNIQLFFKELFEMVKYD